VTLVSDVVVGCLAILSRPSTARSFLLLFRFSMRTFVSDVAVGYLAILGEWAGSGRSRSEVDAIEPGSDGSGTERIPLKMDDA
jgi:hypothetical protein